jgi:hypothetical protein
MEKGWRPVENRLEKPVAQSWLAVRFPTGLSPFPQRPNRAELHFPTGPATSHFIYKTLFSF